MRKWDEAIKYSSKVIDSNYYLLSSCTNYVSENVSYYKYMWTSDLSTEAIWKVGFTVNSYGGSLGQIFLTMITVATVRIMYRQLGLSIRMIVTTYVCQVSFKHTLPAIATVFPGLC